MRSKSIIYKQESSLTISFFFSFLFVSDHLTLSLLSCNKVSMTDIESVPLLSGRQNSKSKKKYGYYISAAVLLLVGAVSIGCVVTGNRSK